MSLTTGLLIGFVIGCLVPRRYIHRWRIAVPPFRAIGPWLHDHVVAVATTAIVLAMLTSGATIAVFGIQQQQQQERDQRDAAAQTMRDRHERAFARCQAAALRDFLAAVGARSDSSRKAILAPSKSIAALQALLVHLDAPSDAQKRRLAALIDANKKANKAYFRYVHTQEDNPLPEIPDCSKDSQ